jgi:hypothetical protein
MEARGAEVQEFPVLIWRTLDYVVDGLGSFVLLAAWLWLFSHRDLGLDGCVAIGALGAGIRELNQGFRARNCRIILDGEGVSARNLLGKSRRVARWDEITGVVWVVWRRPVSPGGSLRLETVDAAGRPRRVRLGSGNPTRGLPIAQAIAERLALVEEVPPAPQSPWVAAIYDRKQYVAWRRPVDESG